MVNLSVCVFSDRSPRHLAAALAPFREVASELVVALDDRAPDLDPTPLREVADKVIVAPFRWPLEANQDWLMAQCSGDWVLRMDGDEVPSRALVELLAGDSWHRGVTHCYVPRRWLVDAGRSWLKLNPWWPDLQLRLIKNEAGLARFCDEVHGPSEVIGRSRVLDGAIYHLDLLERSLEDRREKVRYYHRHQPGLRTFGGLAMGSYYTPELVTRHLPTVAVPGEDWRLIHPALSVDVGGIDLPATEQEGVPVQDPAWATALDVQHAEASGYAGRGLELMVTVTNTTDHVLDPRAEHPVRIGCQWIDSAGTTKPEEGRADLPCPLQPGDRETVMLPTRIPPTEGKYTLSVGVVEEWRQWSLRAPDIRFSAQDQPRITLVGGYSPFRHLGDDLIARSLIDDLSEEFPEVDLMLLADDPDAIARRFHVPTAPTAVGIHHSNIRHGRRGIVSVDDAAAAARRWVAGETVGSEDVAGLVDAIRRSDMLVFAAAGSLTSAFADWALWPRLIEAEVAALCGVPVVITSAGIGPFTGGEHALGMRRLMKLADEVQVRDHLSLGALSDLGTPGTVTVVPDASSWFTGAEEGSLDEFLTDRGMNRERPYIVASVRAEDRASTVHQVAACAAAAARVLDATMVLVPHCGTAPHDDRPALAAMTDHLAPDLDVVILDDIPPDPLAVGLVRTARVSIGTRFHNAVLSASAGRPATLFYESEYDELRARGLAAMPGNAVNVRDASAGFAGADLLDVLREPSTAPAYSNPHPLVDTVRRVGIMGADGARVPSRHDRREASR